MLSAWKRQACVYASAGLLALLCGPVVAPRAHAQTPPPQEPGVTQRIFQLPRAPSELCPIKAGQTPNIDVLKPAIDWNGNDAFGGLSDNFIVHAIANLTVQTAGTYTFRLTSDDGSELLIDDALVIDNDGLHGAEDVDGEVELTAGMHALRVNYFEAGGDQVLTLSWKRPGDSAFSVVPDSVLSTDAGVVRVTAPGSKQCEGDVDSPGDGLPLESVNPAYDLVNLRPAGFEPKVTGLEWMGDDLLVLTWGDDDGDPSSTTAAGEVWRLSGVKEAGDPGDVTPTKIAEGLREPMGIKVVDGDIYISEKHQLSKLVDADADGSYEAKDQIATWPFDGNFHEFAFGLLYKDGFFYLNLSVSIDLGGASTVPQGSVDRGTHLKINKDTGEVQYVAGGLRTPHGIGWGPDDEIFVTDNQGGWLPANKLIHIQPGRFYNHYTTGPDGEPGRFDDQKPTPPAIWMPHNDIANSPSQPVLIPDGPFAGQMWVADVTYGGIQRAFLEKVDGEYQGAYFRMTQGLESGITHLLLQDDGSIIVGGLGAGGNWGQTGKLMFGLQKLVPNGTQTFDIQKMELADGGFDLTYTKPLSEATLADLASKYRVQQWTYVPTAAYGGPKVAEETLTVTDATVSADHKTVSLEIDGLKPNRVVYVRSPRPFEAEDGEPLLSTEAWYTLNNLPGYVAPVSEGLYELEDGVLSGGAQFDTEHAGYTGTGFVSGFGTVGASVKVDADAPKAGDYRMALRYTNGPNPFDGPKTVTLIVNGESRQITLPATGTWTNYRLYVDGVTLDAGENTIEIKHAEGDDGHVNLDSLRLAPAGVTRYEAEAGTLAGGAHAETEHAGYSGLGYVGGYQNEGASTTFTVNALADAATDVEIGYANGPNPFAGTKEVSLYVNDQFVKKLSLPDTGAWTSYATVGERLQLRAGSNDISIRYDAGDDGNVNFDYLDVTQNEPVQCPPTFEPDDEFDGAALDRCRWSTILNEDVTGYSLADGKLHIKAQEGDIVGGTVSARNVALQAPPLDGGSWAATTKVSLDGTDDYVQGGLVAHASAANWGKLVVMREPSGEWVVELARASGWQDSPPLPAGAQNAISLQMIAVDGQLRGRYSLDDGETWTEVGTGFPLTGLAGAGVGLSAYNGTGAETGSFEYFHLGEPPELEPPPPCEEPYTPEAGYTMLFDGTDESLADWTYAGSGTFVREDCAIRSVGGFGLMYTKADFDAPYSLKLEWMMPGDDNSGVFVGFPDTGANTDQTSIDQGEEIQIDATDNPAQTTGAIYLEQAADLELRDEVLNPPGDWNEYEIVVRADRIVVYLNGTKINEWVDDDPVSDLATGRIGLQMHGAGDDVYFRNVRIKDLADTAPPQTSAALDPAEPGAGGTYDGPVGVTLSAAGDAAFTEYRVNTNGEQGEWVRADNDAGDDPFETAFTVSADGDHVVEYRSTDAGGNEEAVQSLAFSIETEGGEDPDAPTVQAFADPTAGEAPLDVQFSATGLDPQGGALIYRWEFSEGGSTIQQSPRRRYEDPGTYTATVTVTDPEGKTASDTVEVVVSERPNAAPTVFAAADPTTGRAPLTVKFGADAFDADGPRSEITYLWDFGDDGAGAFGRNASHTYTAPGTYTATVTATDADGGFDTAEMTIVVDGPPANQAPTVEVAAAPRSGTAPLPVRFTSAARDPEGAQLLMVWDFGDGVKAGGPSISHTYHTPGTYTATLTVTDPGGETATASVEITVSGPAARATPPRVSEGGVSQGDVSQGDVAGESAEGGARLKARRSQRMRRALRLRVACPERCAVRAVLRHSGERIGKSRKLRIRDERRHTLRVRLSRKVRRELRAAMRRADRRSLKVRVVLKVRTADGRSTIRRGVRLKR
jgi:PKD repeat protein